MRKAVWASIAAVAVISPMVVATTVAHAAPSKDTTRFCTVPATMKAGCTISVAFGALTDGVNEGGGRVKAILTGAPNQKIDFAAFHITGDAKGQVTKLTRVSKPITAEFNTSGSAIIDIPVDTMKSPMTGGKGDFMVATADTTDPKSVPGNTNRKWDQFQINSARAKFVGGTKPRNGRYYVPGEHIGYSLQAGIQGHTYVVQIKLDGKWVTANIDSFQNGLIRKSGLGAVHWSFSDKLAPGKYQVRVSNTAKLDDPVYAADFEIVADPSSVPTKPGTATPTKPATTAPSTPATPSKPGTATPTKPGTATPTKPGTATPAKPGTTTPTTPGTPRATPTAPPAETRKVVQFKHTDGTSTPQYKLGTDNVLRTKVKLLDAQGQPISGATITLHSTKDRVRVARLGGGRTAADGSFEIAATLPAGWQADPSFNVELAYDGDKANQPASLHMRPQVTTEPGVTKPVDDKPVDDMPADDKPADDKPSEDLPPMPAEKDDKGGLAQTGR